MKISDKKRFKKRLKEKIIKYINSFPIFFWGNIIINVFLALLAVLIAGMIVLSLYIKSSDALAYGIFFLAALFKIMEITFSSLKNNLRLLVALKKNHYESEIEEYELDQVVDFIKELPLKREEVERIKVTLSYGKLVDILELIGIISCQNDVYDLDVKILSDFLAEDIVQL